MIIWASVLRTHSPWGAAKAGDIYTGVCIDTASTLGMCGERNAIANMITDGESQIAKVVAICDGKVDSPYEIKRCMFENLAAEQGHIIR